MIRFGKKTHLHIFPRNHFFKFATTTKFKHVLSFKKLYILFASRLTTSLQPTRNQQAAGSKINPKSIQNRSKATPGEIGTTIFSQGRSPPLLYGAYPSPSKYTSSWRVRFSGQDSPKENDFLGLSPILEHLVRPSR